MGVTINFQIRKLVGITGKNIGKPGSPRHETFETALRHDVLGKAIRRMFTRIAFSLFNTLDSIATPCSLMTIGGYRTPPQLGV